MFCDTGRNRVSIVPLNSEDYMGEFRILETAGLNPGFLQVSKENLTKITFNKPSSFYISE